MFSGKDKSKEKDSKSKDGKDSGSSGSSKDSKHFSGGNHQRESFNKKASESSSDAGKSKSPASDMDTSMDNGSDSEEPKTTITHHADGTHTTEHSDGEVSDHPSMDDAAQYMSAKHGGGMGMDPMSDMSQILGPDGGNGAMEQAGGHGMPMGGAMPGKRGMPSLY